jgi:hypothetical protein
MAYMGGWWDEIKDILGDLGADPNIIAAIAKAEASPTYANVAAVDAAYRERGSSPPPQLMGQLWDRYYASIGYTLPGIPPRVLQTATNWAPVLVAAAIAFALAMGGRR